MSLILEALKKSERQRQIGTAPTLATPPMNRKRKRSLLPWLVVAIVIAGGAGWWLSRESAPEPTSIADAPPAVKTAPAAATVPKPEVPMTTVSPPPEIAATPAVVPGKAPNQESVGVADTSAESAPAPPPPAAPINPPPMATIPASVPATEPVAVSPAAAPPSVAQAAPATTSAAASLPLLWELPYDKRKDIPKLTMSLQVYADDPLQRFAIVNDERHVEGDDLGEGLILKEIAPEGLVVEFRGERFLFPRGGR